MSGTSDPRRPALPFLIADAPGLPPPLRARLIAVLLRWEQWDLACPLLEQAVAEDPTPAWRLRLCRALLALGETEVARELALALFHEASDAQAPRSASDAGLYAMGDLLAAEGKLEEAETLYRRIRRDDAPARGAALRLAGLRLRAGRTQEARAMASERLAERGRTLPRPWMRLLRETAAAAGAAGEAAAWEAALTEAWRRDRDRLARRLAAWQASTADLATGPAAIPAESGRKGGARLAASDAEETAPYEVTVAPRRATDAVFGENGPAADVATSDALGVELRGLLRRIWGYTEFRPGQDRAIRRALAGESTLVVMPTGAGKSLCYQLSALRLPGVTVVISPLIALMRDQIEGLPPELQQVATQLNSSLEPAEMEARLRGIARGAYRLVYAAPERLRQRPFVHALRTAGVSLFVVDEVHCVSLWGHDFRPDYLFLGDVLAALGEPPVMAMTATATPAIQTEILAELRRDFDVVDLGTYRPNLTLEVERVPGDAEKQARLLEVCRAAAGPALIYVSSRRRAEHLAELLREHGIAAGYYHARMEPEDRDAAQTAFMAGETRVLAATIAFGMGIDKRDIRHVIHYDLPRSLESYHQEVGRAGRDGEPAHCLLLHTHNDATFIERWAREDVPTPEAVLAIFETVTQLLAGGDPLISLDDLERETELTDTDLRVALSLLERVGALRRDFDTPRMVTLYVWDARADAAFADFVERARLRERQRLAIETRDLCERTGMAPAALEEALLHWAERGWLGYRPSARALLLTPAPPFAPSDDPPGAPEEALADLRARITEATARMEEEALRRAAAVVQYADSFRCRHAVIADHFGQPLGGPCGHCDRCVGGSRLYQGDAASARALFTTETRRHGEERTEKHRTGSSDPYGRPGAPPREAPMELPVQGGQAPDVRHVVLTCLAELPAPLSRADVIRVLVGMPESPVLRDRASQFGALASLGVAGVASLLEELLLAGLVIGRRHLLGSHLVLTRAGRRVLRGEEGAERASFDEVLEQLRGWRQAQARAERRPPFFLLTDATLRAIARERPRTIPQFMAVPGVGVERGRAYGGDILRLLRDDPGRR
jgi:ATP-dependent DNA helicase RecQ